MRKLIALWLVSMVVAAGVASSLTLWFVHRPESRPAQELASNGLPWAMGVTGQVEQVPEGVDATGVFINLPVNCSAFSMAKAVLVADEARIRRVGLTRDVVTDLRGSVQLRYTVLHD